MMTFMKRYKTKTNQQAPVTSPSHLKIGYRDSPKIIVVIHSESVHMLEVRLVSLQLEHHDAQPETEQREQFRSDQDMEQEATHLATFFTQT